MDEGIPRTNIAHFEKLLATETDEAKRDVLLKLLAGERVKLATALGQKRMQGG